MEKNLFNIVCAFGRTDYETPSILEDRSNGHNRYIDRVDHFWLTLGAVVQHTFGESNFIREEAVMEPETLEQIIEAIRAAGEPH